MAGSLAEKETEWVFGFGKGAGVYAGEAPVVHL
jgi:hypothetical protein